MKYVSPLFPFYFSEWMVWNSLVLAAIPSWWRLQRVEPIVLRGALGLGLIFVSRVMYTTLVYYSGAVPAEFYSVKKRPDYAAYQQRTNRFFPGPQRSP
ncbi:MAG: hypothetical protein AAF654_07500 [Myxococcota bacterium]